MFSGLASLQSAAHFNAGAATHTPAAITFTNLSAAGIAATQNFSGTIGSLACQFTTAGYTTYFLTPTASPSNMATRSYAGTCTLTVASGSPTTLHYSLCGGGGGGGAAGTAGGGGSSGELVYGTLTLPAGASYGVSFGAGNGWLRLGLCRLRQLGQSRRYQWLRRSRRAWAVPAGSVSVPRRHRLRARGRERCHD